MFNSTEMAILSKKEQYEIQLTIHITNFIRADGGDRKSAGDMSEEYYAERAKLKSLKGDYWLGEVYREQFPRVMEVTVTGHSQDTENCVDLLDIHRKCAPPGERDVCIDYDLFIRDTPCYVIAETEIQAWIKLKGLLERRITKEDENVAYYQRKINENDHLLRLLNEIRPGYVSR